MAYHIVRISTNGYHRAHTFQADSLEDAAREASDRKWRTATMGYVLRDGHTGRRYTVAHCKEIAGIPVTAG